MHMWLHSMNQGYLLHNPTLFIALRLKHTEEAVVAQKKKDEATIQELQEQVWSCSLFCIMLGSLSCLAQLIWNRSFHLHTNAPFLGP